jgi:hypothetical protein
MRRIRDPQLNKIYPDPEGPGHLTKGAYEKRKEKVDSDHQTLHNQWEVQSGMPQQFDVGRLRSPMWQIYRDYFNKQIKQKKRPDTARNKYKKPLKADWESKWEHPDKHGKTTKEMLKMDTTEQEARKLTNNQGKNWLSDEIVEDILNKISVDLKHKRKNDGNAENILLVPSSFWQAVADADEDPEFKRLAGFKFWKGKRPQDYSKVLFPFIDFGHWVLVVMNFESAEGELEMYDSRNQIVPTQAYHGIRESIEAFLKVANGADGKLCKKFTVKAVPHKVIHIIVDYTLLPSQEPL